MQKWHVSYVIHLKIKDMNGSKMGPLLSERPFFLLKIYTCMEKYDVYECGKMPLRPSFARLSFFVPSLNYLTCIMWAKKRVVRR